MSAQPLLPLDDRAHCQKRLVGDAAVVVGEVGVEQCLTYPTQPRGGVMVTTPPSSASVTVTVTASDPERGVVSSSSVAVTVTE